MIFDTRDARHALSSTSRTSLVAQAGMYLRVGPWKADVVESEDEEDDKGTILESTPLVRLLPYNALDCVRTAQIAQLQRAELAASDARTRRIYQQQLRLARVASAMSLKGFPFDKRQAENLDRELTAIFEREAQAFRRLLGRRAPGFRISPDGGVNPTDFRALLYEQCRRPGIASFGLQVPFNARCWTDGGEPSLEKNALLILYTQADTPDEVRAILKQAWKVDAPLKLRSTYIRSEHVRRALGPDGRIHSRINSAGPETYRWSCSKPNLFNLAEDFDEEDGSLQGTLPNVRSLYVAPRGFAIVHRDFAQLELEVMAEYTGDAALRRLLNTGDAHTARVREWFNKGPNDEVPKRLRRQTKVVGFSSQYDASLELVYLKVVESMLDAKYEEVAVLHSLFREKHDGIRKHWASSLEFAKQHGFNESAIMGYRRYYPPGTPLKTTETSNYAIQATAAAVANCTMVGADADSFKRSMVYRLRKEYPDAWLAMHVYDSFDVICREKDAQGVGQLMDECMRGPWHIGSKPVFLRSDMKVGGRWSEV